MPGARCERCDRPAELSRVSVLDGWLISMSAVSSEMKNDGSKEAMQEDNECATRCCTDDVQEEGT